METPQPPDMMFEVNIKNVMDEQMDKQTKTDRTALVFSLGLHYRVTSQLGSLWTPKEDDLGQPVGEGGEGHGEGDGGHPGDGDVGHETEV